MQVKGVKQLAKAALVGTQSNKRGAAHARNARNTPTIAAGARYRHATRGHGHGLGLATNVNVNGLALQGKRTAQRCRAAISQDPAEVEGVEVNSTLRIKLKSFHSEPLQEAVEAILEIARYTGCDDCGPVYLPTRRRKYTILRSPHVNKKSREQFETRTHQRLIDLKNVSAQTIDGLMALDLPAGVDVEVKL